MKFIFKYLIATIFFTSFVFIDSFCQANNQPDGPSSTLNDTVITLQEIDKKIVISSLMKGRYTIGVSGQLRTDKDKNYDNISQYILDWNDRNFFLKLTSSYFVKDRKSLGMFVRHARQNLDYSYVTVIGDTIINETTERSWSGGIYYKMHTPVFNSKRVYWLSIAELGISHTSRNDKTILPLRENLSETESWDTGLIGRFGFLVFPFKNFSIEGTIAAIGLGYDMQKFYYNEEPNGTSNDFVVLFTPDILSIQFKISTYF